MANEIPTIQILDKKNYFQQALVSLPNALPYPPLGPSSLRLRTSVLGLTVNNFTYAALGSLLHWWDVHPLPESTPAPYNDPSKYGRINAWGYAEVLESTVPAIPAGSHLWGYVPLGTLAQDLQVRLHPDEDIKDQVFVTSAHRQHVMPIYNRYFVYPPSSGRGAAIAQRHAAVAHDAVLRVMHLTAFLMESFSFSSDASRVVKPQPGPEVVQWGKQAADLGDATVLIFAPGSKAAVIFASLLAQRTGAEGRPRHIVGVSSEASSAFVKSTGVYDRVALTSDQDFEKWVPDITLDRKLVIFDFGGRAGVAQRWAASLADGRASDKFLFVLIGSGILDPTVAAQPQPQQAPTYPVVRVNADDMRTHAIEKLGEARYFEEEGKSWEKFREQGIKGLSFTWGEGMQDVIKGWDRLARGEVLPSEGLVFKL